MITTPTLFVLGAGASMDAARGGFSVSSGRGTSFVGYRRPSAAVAPLRPLLAVINYELSASTASEVSVSTNLEALEAEVLQLAPVERSHLLERLIASLDSDPEVENAWEREADRREAELESGSILAVSGQEAIARLRAKLQR